MQKEKIVIHLVPSAHWDREWYLSFPRFRVRLVRLIDKVIKLLESGRYPSYLLDGQTVMLEDYLAVKPENEERLKKLISSGKLVVGPWYTVPDTFLPCGESLLKNLELGEKIKKKYCGKGEVAYTPDSFGLNAQFAQIVNKFGYKYVYFTRGERLAGREDESGKISDIKLAALDGTTLLAECDKYSTGSGLVVPGIWKNFNLHKVTEADAIRCVDWTFDYQNTRTGYKNRLWICGTDHLEPREDLPDIVKFLNEKYRDVAEFGLSGMDEYFKAIESEGGSAKTALATGEQCGNYDKHYELSNTLSSRADIKLLNREAENLTFGVFESLDGFEKPCDPFEYTDRRAIAECTYKDMIRAHAHDSICTCSPDETCADEKDRLRGVKETAQELIKDDLTKIGGSLKGNGGEILVFNPLPYERKEIIEGFVSVPYDVDGNRISDEKGNAIKDSFASVLFKKRIDIESMKYTTFEEIATDETRSYLPSDAGKEDVQTGLYYRFSAVLPPLSFARYKVTGGGTDDAVISGSAEMKCGETVAEFSADGLLTIIRKNKKTIKVYPVIGLDDGDSYTYANVSKIPEYKANIISFGKTEETASYTRKSVKYVFENVGKTGGKVEAEIVYTLDKTSEVTSAKTKIFNADCYGFRLRLVCEFDETAKDVFSDGAFGLTKRPVGIKRDLSKDIFTRPMRNLFYVPFAKNAVSVYSRSFYEYEAVNDDVTKVFFTLLRSTDKVYDTFLPTKDESGAGKGVRWRSRGHKMQGDYEFSFGIKLYDDLPGENEVITDALKFQIPPVAFGINPRGDKSLDDYRGFSLEGGVFSRIFEKEENGKKRIFARVYDATGKRSVVIARKGDEEKSITLDGGKIGEIDVTEFFGGSGK